MGWGGVGWDQIRRLVLVLVRVSLKPTRNELLYRMAPRMVLRPKPPLTILAGGSTTWSIGLQVCPLYVVISNVARSFGRCSIKLASAIEGCLDGLGRILQAASVNPTT